MSKDIREMIDKVKSFKQFVNEQKDYKSFKDLSDGDLYNIANWAIFKGGYILYDDLNDEEAIKEIVDDLKLLLKDDYPNGFRNTPNTLTLYRIVKLDKPNDLNTANLGGSWFSDIDRIKDKNFIDQLFNNSKNLYMITAEVPITKVDIPRSLIQRITTHIENEIVLSDDTNIKITSLDKIS
ncbi:MAG: hypothetical protein ACOC22_01535 [bacterium]